MSIAEQSAHADMLIDLRRDLAATRNALERSQEALESEKRRNERLSKVCRVMAFKAHQMALELEQLSREG